MQSQKTLVKQVLKTVLYILPISPVTVPVHCGHWNVEGVAVPNVEC